MDDYLEANRRHWDAVVPGHLGAGFYDVEGFKAGKSSLWPVELKELGDVRGKSLLHLQCHFGLDTLSWAREGATVTGVDFSEAAIAQARALAAELGIDARFLVSDVYGLPERLDASFDIVFTSYGVLCWLPDLSRWARVAAQFVKPGGTFYIVEFHPFGQVFDDAPDVTDLRVRCPYFPGDAPVRFDVDASYAGDAKLPLHETYEWPHPVSEVITALVDAGLRIEFFHEFAESSFRYLPVMEEAGDGLWRVTNHHGSVPLVYSIKATKEG